MKLLTKFRDNFWILAILFVAGWIRLIGINQSLWLDEAIEWWAVTSFELQKLLTGYMIGDFNPPGHHLLMWFWVRIFGDSEIALRMPAVIFGVGIVYLTYMLAKLVLGDKDFEIGVKPLNLKFSHLAAILAAFNGLLVYYSQETRMYSQAAFFTAGAMYFLIRRERGKKEQRDKRSKGDYLLFFIFLSLGLYSHYLVWLLLPFLLIWGRKYLLPLAVTVPWWPVLWQQVQAGLSASANPVWAQLSRTNIKNVVLTIVKFVTGRVPFPESAGLQAVVILMTFGFWLLVAMGVKEVWKQRQERPQNLVVLVWAAGPLILGGLAGLVIPVFSYFRFLFLLPPIIILAVIGSRRVRFLVEPMILAGMISTAVYVSSDKFQRENWRGMVSALRLRSDTPTVLIHPAVRPPFDYYDRGKSRVVVTTEFQPEDTDDFWYVPYAEPIFDPLQSTRKLILESGFSQTFKNHYREVTLEHWMRVGKQ